MNTNSYCEVLCCHTLQRDYVVHTYKSLLFIWIILSVFSLQVFSEHNVLHGNLILGQGNSRFFHLKPNTVLKVENNTKLLLNTNVNIHSNIIGMGILVLTSKKNINFFANNNKINTLVVTSKTKVRLKGNLQIMRNVRILDEGKIILDNFDLILSSLDKLEASSRNRIVENSVGHIIVQEINNNCFAKNIDTTKINKTHISTADFLCSFTSLDVYSYSYLNFVNSLDLSNIYLEKDSPPPK